MSLLADRSRRVPLHLPVRLRVSDPPSSFVEHTRTLNVSGGGICLESHQSLEVGTRVELAIELPRPLRHHFGNRAVYRARAVVEEAAGALQSSGRRTFVAKADARIPGQMAGFVEAAAGALGGVDFLVNNVGVFRQFSLEEISEEALDEAFDVNVKAAVMAARAAAPYLRRRGGGAIVNVAS